ncbi:aminoglycoside phosphotransferase family protein [Pseudactinotalea sp.]|uniref:aminoglycoside phosphotransferase family protein n=1 Tax=Pseudactinotalea sp. TaxID=1926260 RepID=UPI003B3A985E
MSDDREWLLPGISVAVGAAVVDATWESRSLHGGTLGEVQLLTGAARLKAGGAVPFRVVHKVQRRWERPGDPGSWRREHDLVTAGLGDLFASDLRWPTCYDARIDESVGEIHLVMEYVEGTSGRQLSTDALVRAAGGLGRLQGRLAAMPPDQLPTMANLSPPDLAEHIYRRYRAWPRVHEAVRSPDSEIPAHLRRMVTVFDASADAALARISQLPLVLCHRDFWVANLIDADGGIVLLDWDTTGWGYLGEDLASLLADEADVPRMLELYHRCVPAYYAGFAEFVDVSVVVDDCVVELILLLFGYRLVEWYLDAASAEERAEHVAALEQIFLMQSAATGTGR